MANNIIKIQSIFWNIIIMKRRKYTILFVCADFHINQRLITESRTVMKVKYTYSSHDCCNVSDQSRVIQIVLSTTGDK